MKFWTWILAHKTLSIIVAVILSATLVTSATLLVIHTRPIESENVGGGAVTTTTTTDVTSTTAAADTTTSTDSSTTSTSTDGSSTTSGTGTTTTTVKGATTTTVKGATTGTTKTPTTKVTVKPTATPTTKATVKPTAAPTTKATAKPTAAPTTKTTAKPTTTTTTKKVTTTTTKPPVLNTCPNGWQNEASGHFMLCGKCSWCVANTMSLQEAENYANAYLQELGAEIDYTATPDNAGFMPPMTWDVGDDFETMKWHIKYQVDITISHRGLGPGHPMRAVAAYRPNEYDNTYGWLYILH